MARTVGMDALEEKIEKAQQKVIRAEIAYEAAVDALQVLLDKQDALRTQELMKAIANSNKSYQEILEFVKEA